MSRDGAEKSGEVSELRAAEVEGVGGLEEEVPSCFWDSEEDDEACKEGKEEEPPMDEEEAVKPKAAAQPRLPTSEEKRKHELTHVPFRNWCEHCQRGKGQSRAHRRKQRQKVRKIGETGMDLPIVSMDYMYLEYTYSREKKSEQDKEAVEKGMRPILVVHDSRSSAVFAHDVNRKGMQGSSVKRVMQDLKDLGYARKDVVLKSDQEPSMRAVIDAVTEQRTENSTVKEHSPVGESQSNGAVESAIKSVQGQIRTLKLDLESNMGKQLLRESDIMPWLIEWAGKLITRYRVTATGLSAFGNLRGRESRAEVAKFGERILYMPLKGVVFQSA